MEPLFAVWKTWEGHQYQTDILLVNRAAAGICQGWAGRGRSEGGTAQAGDGGVTTHGGNV